jgi:Ser/Thr protein kinase RdoA (MazF antagonist)
MPDRFDEAMDVALATAPHDERLRRIAALRPRVVEMSRRLSELPGAPSLDHNDLHGGNVFLGSDGAARFFDWGDAVVSHPFASLLVLRSVVRWLQDVDGETPAERRIVDAYLEPFGSLGARVDLLEAAELACELGKVARSLVWARAVAPMSPDEDDPDGFRTAPVDWLLEMT